MIVISDTSSIGYLIIIDKLFLLKDNFSEIIIPQKVHNEVLQLSPKYNLHKYLNSDWININTIVNNKFYNELLNQVDEGEAEAIVLSHEISADLLLIDERKGTLLARSLGIKTIGLLGVLLLSKEKKIIPFVKPFLDELISNTTFRINNILYQNVLKQANEL
jgi:predicted nucleic acid-binding protein